MNCCECCAVLPVAQRDCAEFATISFPHRQGTRCSLFIYLTQTFPVGPAGVHKMYHWGKKKRAMAVLGRVVYLPPDEATFAFSDFLFLLCFNR